MEVTVLWLRLLGGQRWVDSLQLENEKIQFLVSSDLKGISWVITYLERFDVGRFLFLNINSIISQIKLKFERGFHKDGPARPGRWTLGGWGTSSSCFALPKHMRKIEWEHDCEMVFFTQVPRKEMPGCFVSWFFSFFQSAQGRAYSNSIYGTRRGGVFPLWCNLSKHYHTSNQVKLWVPRTSIARRRSRTACHRNLGRTTYLMNRMIREPNQSDLPLYSWSGNRLVTIITHTSRGFYGRVYMEIPRKSLEPWDWKFVTVSCPDSPITSRDTSMFASFFQWYFLIFDLSLIWFDLIGLLWAFCRRKEEIIWPWAGWCCMKWWWGCCLWMNELKTSCFNQLRICPVNVFEAVKFPTLEPKSSPFLFSWDWLLGPIPNLKGSFKIIFPSWFLNPPYPPPFILHPCCCGNSTFSSHETFEAALYYSFRKDKVLSYISYVSLYLFSIPPHPIWLQWPTTVPNPDECEDIPTNGTETNEEKERYDRLLPPFLWTISQIVLPAFLFFGTMKTGQEH